MLIIEDEPLIALDLQLLLEENGATSSAIATTEDEAVRAAIERRPAFITADVALKHGYGPVAVRTIVESLGYVPVVFITATPDACVGFAPPERVLRKPVSERAVIRAFRELAGDALSH